MINIDDIIINMLCIKKGIVPFSGTSSGHIYDTLESLGPEDRKKATRKFRKYLKRAIHQKARRCGPVDSTGYKWYKKYLDTHTGLISSGKKEKNKLSSFESAYRLKLVKEYFRNNIELNSEFNI